MQETSINKKGEELSIDEISKILKIEKEEIVMALDAARSIESIDRKMNEDENTTIGEKIASNIDDYEISNKDENIFISLESIGVSYDEFVSDTYLKQYLEDIQTSGNIKIEKSLNKEKDKKDYYLLEGTNNSYIYVITVIGNDEKVILIKTQYIDNVSYEKLKDVVVDFLLPIGPNA